MLDAASDSALGRIEQTVLQLGEEPPSDCSLRVVDDWSRVISKAGRFIVPQFRWFQLLVLFLSLINEFI